MYTAFKLPTTDRDIYWLAGILEGEGCFSIAHGETYTQIKITMLSTDQDIVQRIYDMVGGCMYGPRSNGINKKGLPNKPVWTWTVSGYSSALLMKLLENEMGQRRKEKIKLCLEIYKLGVTRTVGYSKEKREEVMKKL